MSLAMIKSVIVVAATLYIVSAVTIKQSKKCAKMEKKYLKRVAKYDCAEEDPCTAGNYMTKRGCKQCGDNQFSGDEASTCSTCPTGKVSAAGSTSIDDCQYDPCTAGNYMTESGCMQCGDNTFSGDEASTCSNCPSGTFSAAGSSSIDDCQYEPSSYKAAKGYCRLGIVVENNAGGVVRGIDWNCEATCDSETNCSAYSLISDGQCIIYTSRGATGDGREGKRICHSKIKTG